MQLHISDILYLVCGICNVFSQDENVIFDNRYLFNSDSTSNVDFWFNFDHINDFTKSIIVMEGWNDASKLSGVSDKIFSFKTELIRHLNKNYKLPLVIFKYSSANETQKIESLETLQNEIFIIIFDSIESLQHTLNHFVSIYSVNNRASFVFVILLTKLANFPCESETTSLVLREKSSKYFQTFWEKFKMIQVIFLFPYLCGREFLITCDVIKTFANDNYEEGVRIVTKDTYEPNSSLHFKYTQFNGYPLKINLFKRVPTASKKMPKSFMDIYWSKDINRTENYGGLDGMVLGNLVKRLNFTPIIAASADKVEYGKFVNGTYTGSLGDVVYKRMDISFNTRFLKSYDTDEIEFTYPIYYDQFCILAPKAQRVPQWMSIFLIFSIDVWILILLSTLFAGFVWWFLRTKLSRNDKKSGRINPFLFYYMDICLIFISNPVVLPRVYKEKLFMAMCLLFNLIIAGVFQGQLSTVYSTITYYQDINTLKQLDKSGLHIATSNVDIFGYNISQVGNSLSKKIVQSSPISDKIAASKRTIAVVERRTDATSVIELSHTNRYGDQLLHIVNECPRSYHLSYIVYKGHPFLHQINRFLECSFSAGLSSQWYHVTEFSLLLNERINRKERDEDRKLAILDVQASFMLLGIGLILSSFVFIVEVLNYKMRHKKVELTRVNGETLPVYRKNEVYLPKRIYHYS